MIAVLLLWLSSQFLKVLQKLDLDVPVSFREVSLTLRPLYDTVVLGTNEVLPTLFLLWTESNKRKCCEYSWTNFSSWVDTCKTHCSWGHWLLLSLRGFFNSHHWSHSMSEIWPSYAVDEKIDGGIHNCEKASDEIKDPLKGWSKIEIFQLKAFQNCRHPDRKK